MYFLRLFFLRIGGLMLVSPFPDKFSGYENLICPRILTAESTMVSTHFLRSASVLIYLSGTPARQSRNQRFMIGSAGLLLLQGFASFAPHPTYYAPIITV